MGLKIPWGSPPVWVRFPPPAPTFAQPPSVELRLGNRNRAPRCTGQQPIRGTSRAHRAIVRTRDKANLDRFSGRDRRRGGLCHSGPAHAGTALCPTRHCPIRPFGRARIRAVQTLRGRGFCGPSRDRVYGLNTRILRSRIGLKCFALLVHSVNPCSAAVAATRASPARRPCERAYSSMYTAAR